MVKKTGWIVLFASAVLLCLNNPLGIAQSSENYSKAVTCYKQANTFKNKGRKTALYRQAVEEAQWALQDAGPEQATELENIITDSRNQLFDLEADIMQARNEKRVVEGMTKTDVLNILGQPTSQQDKDFRGQPNEKWIYQVGESRRNISVTFEGDYVKIVSGI
jgi:hypothetical protein